MYIQCLLKQTKQMPGLRPFYTIRPGNRSGLFHTSRDTHMAQLEIKHNYDESIEIENITVHHNRLLMHMHLAHVKSYQLHINSHK